MSVLTTTLPTVLASFMASAVEFVEALTIVLAVGVVRGWRSAFIGVGAGLLLLALLVGLFGSSLSQVPLPLLQGVVGTLLLLFGLRWLRKAILRAAGVLALHDEQAAYAQETAALRRDGGPGRTGTDMVAVLASFKAVVLEGLEVVFIVIAIGAGGRLLMPATVGAALALALVVGLGLALRRPLSTVPENALKFGVGVLLSAFGSFWVGESLHLDWPGGDLSIGLLAAAFAVLALLLTIASRRLRMSVNRRRPQRTSAAAATPSDAGVAMAVLREVWGLFVDDGWLAVGIVAVLVAVAAATHLGAMSLGVAGAVLVGALSVTLGASTLRRASR
jgi:uncharacterized membrane protein